MKKKLPIIPEVHIRGNVSVENRDWCETALKEMWVDFGIQTHDDGRVWICINGIAWIRFRPER